MLETLRKIFPAVHTHPAKHWSQFRAWHEPFADLSPAEHGVVYQLSGEAISRNGLDLGLDDHGYITVRVS